MTRYISIIVLLLWSTFAHADLRLSNVAGIPAGRVSPTDNADGCLQVNADSGRKMGCTVKLWWDDNTSTLHIDGSISSPGVVEKDAIQVNSIPATDLNILNTVATATEAGVAWTHTTAPAPDTLMASLAPATDTTAGIITATDQTFGGTKTFGNGGIELVPKLEEDETPLCDPEKIGVKVPIGSTTLIVCKEGTEIDLLTNAIGLEGARAADRTFQGAISENTAVEFCPNVESGDSRCGALWANTMGMQEKRPGVKLEYVGVSEPLVVLEKGTGVIRFVFYSTGSLQFGASGPCLGLNASNQIFNDVGCDGTQGAGDTLIANP